MRIAYLAYWNLDANDGVAKKIAAQLAEWRAAGHEAEAFAVAPASPLARARQTRRVVDEALAFHPEVVYLRYDLWLPPLGRLLRLIPTAVEVNADDRAEMRRRGPAVALVNEWNRGRVYAGSAGLVCVTNELARRLAVYGKPATVVANGVDARRVPALRAPANDRPRVIFVGSPHLAWHGVDRLLDLARALPDVDFDLVGPDPEGDVANVTAHGVLAEAEYLPLLARADAAVGSLAMERAGLTEGSPLKVREYLLAGVPTVVGYDDTDFLGREPWFLLKSTDPAEVRTFVEGARGRRVPREEVSHLASQAKEVERLRFLEALAR
jgi:glycosyltransferase involved in cell wall biosynthesis